MADEYRERPTVKGKYTQEDLRSYAYYRKDRAVGTLRALADKPAIKQGRAAFDEFPEFREPISVDTHIEIRIQLSWGGDGDGYKLLFDTDHELMNGLYYWEDWGVYEEVPLDEEELQLVSEAYGSTFTWVL